MLKVCEPTRPDRRGDSGDLPVTGVHLDNPTERQPTALGARTVYRRSPGKCVPDDNNFSPKTLEPPTPPPLLSYRAVQVLDSYCLP